MSPTNEGFNQGSVGGEGETRYYLHTPVIAGFDPTECRAIMVPQDTPKPARVIDFIYR